MANLTIAVNVSESDAVYASGASWVEIDLANDYLVFSSGSDVVADGQPIPSQSDLNSAGVLLDGEAQVVGKYFLADVGSNLLHEISLMGDTEGQYVVAFSFDDATASEPVLELWDDIGLDTIDSTTLGAGTANNSWWKGTVTTTTAPSIGWSGTALAGSSDGHFLLLNDGAGVLTEAKTLYCNLKIVVPGSATTGLNASPVFVCKFASN